MEHFWTYYKVPFFVILGVLIFAGYLVLHYTVFKPKPSAFSAYALNSFYVSEVTSSEEKPVDLFLADFCKKEQFDLTKTQAEINTDYAIDPEKAGNLDVALDLNLTATGLDGDVDILLGPSHLIDYYVPNGFYADTKAKTLRFDVVMSFDITPKEGLKLIYEEVGKLYPDYAVQVVADVDVSD